MSLRPFTSYTPSTVPWFGDIPSHWTHLSLKRVARRYAGGTPDRSNDSFWEEGTIPWINSGEVNQKLIREPSAYITEEAFQNSSARWVPKGALVMALAGQGKTKGMVAHTAIATTCNQSMAAIVPFTSEYNRFLFWMLESQYEAIRNMAGGEQRDGLNLEILGNIPIVLPPLAEALQVAAFLDSKCERLDSLIALKTQFIERLKEKRTALISHVVTKGLPPEEAKKRGFPVSPKMKPSGVDWLGEIPEHWNALRLKTIVKGKLMYGANESAELDDPDLPRYIRITDFGDDGKLRNDTFRSLPVAIAKDYYLADGDILFARSGATVGKTFQYKGENRKACFAGYLIKATPNPELISSDFLYFFTRSANYENWKNSVFSQATIQNIGADKYQNLVLPIPTSINEQKFLVEYLTIQTNKINNIIETVEFAIRALTEYRSSLITAAVTGKIDVREAKS